MHNLRMKGVIEEKIGCYEKYQQDAVSYYECFDKVERKVIKDIKMMKGWMEEGQDDLMICRY